MSEGKKVGDTTERWRRSYSRVSKDLLRDNESTNRERLRRLGLDDLPTTMAVLDIGAGDGNLCGTLEGMGFRRYWGFEYQAELAATHPKRDRIAVASAAAIPFRTATMNAVVVMDVLHHLTPAQLHAGLGEMRRVLRAGGLFYVCEPSNTRFRRFLTVLLMSPLAYLTRFSRDKRAMVEEEKATLVPWLENEPGFADRVREAGFRLEMFQRKWLHHYARFRAI